MTITTFTELKSEIVKWSLRSDSASDDLDTYIQVAEASMFNNPQETLRVNADDTLTTLTMDDTTPSRFIALPSGFLSHRGAKIIIDDYRFDLRYLTPEKLKVRPQTGTPEFFTITSQA